MRLFYSCGIVLFFLYYSQTIQSQTLKQTIRGKVSDTDSKITLVGVSLYIEGTDPVIGTITDNEGNFKFSMLPIGRYNVVVSYLGYSQKVIPNILLGAGKEVYLNIELTENLKKLEEVVVKVRKNKGEPLNEMASVSARSVTVEETQRFAGSFNDPSRMVSSYAGVASDPDGNNDIVIRGNSPRGLLWRIEGVDVANPNHFANDGSTGGPISILNSATLSNSDFFTGAFPAEYGNAYSGVFDIHLRKGNDQKPEFIAQLGVIGTDLTAEGPFSKKSDASYLVNYRYSSLDLLNAAGIKIAGDAVPKFQDMTFNIHVPTKRAGTFQIFGIGGMSNIIEKEKDFTNSYSADMCVSGLNHFYPIDENTYIKSSISFSGTRNHWDYSELEVEPERWVHKGMEQLRYSTNRLSMDLTHKFSPKNTVKIGVSLSELGYNLIMDIYDDDYKVLYNALNDKGGSELIQSYISWKYRPFESLTINTGIHYQYLALNRKKAIEPRIGAHWQITPRQSVSAGFGLHSKTDNISLYLFKDRTADGSLVQNNKDLDFLKAYHYVIAYENRLTPNLNLKVEAYYQDLFNVPVGDTEGSSLSMINATDGYITDKLVNKGKGKNYGLEMSLNKFFARNYYFLVTVSLFESKFTNINGIEMNSRFNNNYIANIVGGKEFPIGKKRNSYINVNIRGTYAGGQYYTPIDVIRSLEKGYEIRDNSKAFSARRDNFIRFDLKVSYRRNKGKTTRVWELDIENVTNNLNVAGDYWNNNEKQIEQYTQLGLLPNINYRIEF
jgi:hypothetical protein